MHRPARSIFVILTAWPSLFLVIVQVLYAFALIPVGFLADKANRPRMLAGGAALWSLLSMGASKVTPCASLHVPKLLAIAVLGPRMHSGTPDLQAVSDCQRLAKYQAVHGQTGSTLLTACCQDTFPLSSQRWRRTRKQPTRHARLNPLLKSRPALQVADFQGLLAIRAGLAAAQATQNPICFSLIPEMFPRRRNLAMSAYNSAIYAGRALSYAAVLIAARLSESTRAGDSGVMMVGPACEAPGPASHLPLLWPRLRMCADGE